MHERYFPACPVTGPIAPAAPYQHESLHGAIPRKCSTCEHLSAGGCTRFVEGVGQLLQLDHGDCGVDGPTDPVGHQHAFFDHAHGQVPRKCTSCAFLGYGRDKRFHCSKDAELWGDFPRGLDWGDWQPPTIDLKLPYPNRTSPELSNFIRSNDRLAFIREHRRLNSSVSLAEAEADFARLRTIAEQMDG